MKVLLSDIRAAGASFFSKRWLVLAVVAVLLLVAGTLAHYPGSVPDGWGRSDGSVASTIGRRQNGTTLYYPVVQFLAMGYSYEITSSQGNPIDPAIDSGDYAVAYNPENPNQAKLLAETPPNYYRWAGWGLGLLIIGVEAFYFGRSLSRQRALPLSERMPKPAAVEPEAEVLPPMPIAVKAAANLAIIRIIAAQAAAAKAAVIMPSPEEPAVPSETPVSETASEPVEPVKAPAEPAKSKPIKKPPATPKSIYVPQLTASNEPAATKPRSATKLKSQLKDTPPKARKPRAIAASTRATKAKKPAAKKASSKRAAKPKAAIK